MPSAQRQVRRVGDGTVLELLPRAPTPHVAECPGRAAGSQLPANASPEKCQWRLKNWVPSLCRWPGPAPAAMAFG